MSQAAARAAQPPEPGSVPDRDWGEFDRVIEPQRAFQWKWIQEIYEYRDLLGLLTWRQLAIRYKQTLLGAAWVILQPLIVSGIFTLVFGKLIAVPSGDKPYFLFTLAAMLPWSFFQQSVNSASQSLVGNVALVSKIYFPRAILPLASVTAGLFDLGVTLSAYTLLAWAYGYPPSGRLLWIPLLAANAALLSFSVGAILAAVNVRFRDVRYTVPFLMQCWMFATPIVYSVDLVPPEYRSWIFLNPMVGVVEGMRAVFLQDPVPFDLVVPGFGLSVGLFALSLVVFFRLERFFADAI